METLFVVVDFYDSTRLTVPISEGVAKDLAFRWNKEKHGFNQPQYIQAIPAARVRNALGYFDWENVNLEVLPCLD